MSNRIGHEIDPTSRPFRVARYLAAETDRVEDVGEAEGDAAGLDEVK